MGCPRCQASYPGTKPLPNGLRESSARAGGRAQPTKTLHLCSAGPAVPGPHGGPRATIHQHVTSEEKTHAGASEADRVSTQKRAKPFVLHTPPAFPFSAPSASEARDESKLSRRMRLSKGSAAVLLVTVRSAPASPPQLCAVPFRPRARPRCLHAVLSKGARIPPPVPASPGAAGEMESPRRLPGIAEPPMGIYGENPNRRQSRLRMSHRRRLRMSHGHSAALGLGITFAHMGTVIAVWSNNSSLRASLEGMTPRHSLS